MGQWVNGSMELNDQYNKKISKLIVNEHRKLVIENWSLKIGH